MIINSNSQYEFWLQLCFKGTAINADLSTKIWKSINKVKFTESNYKLINKQILDFLSADISIDAKTVR